MPNHPARSTATPSGRSDRIPIPTHPWETPAPQNRDHQRPGHRRLANPATACPSGSLPSSRPIGQNQEGRFFMSPAQPVTGDPEEGSMGSRPFAQLFGDFAIKIGVVARHTSPMPPSPNLAVIR